MGDTVVFEGEITPAMDAAFAHGLEITALHNHFSKHELLSCLDKIVIMGAGISSVIPGITLEQGGRKKGCIQPEVLNGGKDCSKHFQMHKKEAPSGSFLLITFYCEAYSSS